MDLCEVATLNHSDDFIFGIALGQLVRNDVDFHCGILYKTQDKIHFIDFCKDRLQTRSIEELGEMGFIFAKYNTEAILEDQALQVPVVCERMLEKKQSFSFAIGYNKTHFDNDGFVVFLNGDFGFTCSTFVLAAMKTALGVELIELENWEVSEESVHMHTKMFEFFKEQVQMNPNKYSEDFLSNFQKRIPDFRYSPEEVSVAITSPTIPSDFEFCKTNAPIICEAVYMGLNK
ncbi:hypothetical protein BH09BAC5_BH09BAC5_08420 [soil metagenome]